MISLVLSMQNHRLWQVLSGPQVARPLIQPRFRFSERRGGPSSQRAASPLTRVQGRHTSPPARDQQSTPAPRAPYQSTIISINIRAASAVTPAPPPPHPVRWRRPGSQLARTTPAVSRLAAAALACFAHLTPQRAQEGSRRRNRSPTPQPAGSLVAHPQAVVVFGAAPAAS